MPDDGPALQGSDRILDFAGVPGGPELEGRVQGRIGPLVRQIVYASALSDRGSGVLFEGASPGQALAGRLMWPVTRRLIVAGMRARPALLPALTWRLDGELAWFAGVLAERGEGLVGEAFGRADLTAAGLLAPLAMLSGRRVDRFSTAFGCRRRSRRPGSAAIGSRGGPLGELENRTCPGLERPGTSRAAPGPEKGVDGCSERPLQRAPSSSTSKISVALGGITPPAPRAP